MIPRRPSRLRRFLLGATAVAIVAGAGVCMELIRRDFYRQQRDSIFRRISQVAATGTDPARLDRRWKRLEARLHEELAAWPVSDLALFALRTAGRTRAEVPGAARVGDRVDLVLHYGDDVVVGHLLPPDRSFRWDVEVRARWDDGNWLVIDHASWTESGPQKKRLDLREVMPAESFPEGEHALTLRAAMNLWLVSPEGEPTLVHQERQDLGTHAVHIGMLRPTSAGD